MNTKKVLSLVVVMAICVSMLGIMPTYAAYAATPPPESFYYALEVASNQPAGKTVVDLYVYAKSDTPYTLVGGTIAIGYQSTLNSTFTIAKEEFNSANSGEENVIRFMPFDNDDTKGEFKGTTAGNTNYHGFSWLIENREQKYVHIDGKGFGMKLGSFEFSEANVAAASVFITNWYDIVSEDKYAPAFNRDIWRKVSDTAGYYQGLYEQRDDSGKLNGVMQTVDIKPSWMFTTITSYDPKKPTTVSVERAVAGTTNWVHVKDYTLATWTGKDNDKDPIYGNGKGTGLYSQGWDNLAEIAFPGDTGIVYDYKIVIAKPGHLSYTITGFNDIGIAGATLESYKDKLPDVIELPCGDVSGTAAPYKDGKIKLNDRDIITRYVYFDVPYNMADTKVPEKREYCSDLSGDGKITIADLNILMLPRNYNKVNISYDINTAT